MRCSVGSAEIGNTSHAGVVPGAFCFTHCSVPVFCRVQPAPSAMSSRPSPSMSCGASVTLSAVVAPAARMTVFSQVGALNQTSSVPLMARMSVRLSPLTSPAHDGVADAEVGGDFLGPEAQGRAAALGLLLHRCHRRQRDRTDREDQGEELRSAGMRLHGAAV